MRDPRAHALVKQIILEDIRAHQGGRYFAPELQEGAAEYAANSLTLHSTWDRLLSLALGYVARKAAQS